jgi:hypothetical protein
MSPTVPISMFVDAPMEEELLPPLDPTPPARPMDRAAMQPRPQPPSWAIRAAHDLAAQIRAQCGEDINVDPVELAARLRTERGARRRETEAYVCTINQGRKQTSAWGRAYQLARQSWTPASPVPACGARTRAGTPCRMTDLWFNGRCKFHGGMSTGPRTPEGRMQSAINGRRGGRPRKGVQRET